MPYITVKDSEQVTLDKLYEVIVDMRQEIDDLHDDVKHLNDEIKSMSRDVDYIRMYVR